MSTRLLIMKQATSKKPRRLRYFLERRMREKVEWLDANCAGRFQFETGSQRKRVEADWGGETIPLDFWEVFVTFYDDNDALHFKLRWS